VPWTHCENDFVFDDEDCPTCGISKAEWTIQVDKTRVFAITRKTFVEIQLADDAGAPLVGERYEILFPSGKKVEGELDSQGLARVEKVNKGDCTITFPDLDAGEWDPAPERAASIDGLAGGGAGEDETPADAAPSWIELQLNDDQGQPAAGLKYRLMLADRQIREGALNDEGVARLEGIVPGSCQVSFPELDACEWSPLS
jgi:hypothetical protein